MVNKNHYVNGHRYIMNNDHHHHRDYKHHWHHPNRQNHHHHHQHHYLCQAVKSSVDSNPELLQTEHMSCLVSSPGLQLIKGGFRSWPSGPRALRFFLRNFVLLFQKILSKINRIYSDGKCPRHPFLNFLDPSLLIVLRTTRPWVSREKMSEPRGEVLKAMSCTHPHWSKELMSQITPWQNILCSYIASK